MKDFFNIFYFYTYYCNSFGNEIQVCHDLEISEISLFDSYSLAMTSLLGEAVSHATLLEVKG